MKNLLSVAILLTILIAPVSQAAISSEQITETNPAILPSNPLYFLKGWGEGFQRFFIKNPVKEAMFDLRVLNQKGAEIALSSELSTDSDQDLNEYLEAATTFVASLSVVTSDDLDTHAAKVFESREQLLDFWLERTVLHIRLHDQFQPEEADPALTASQLQLEGAIETLRTLIGEGFEDSLRLVASAQDSDFALRYLPVASE